MKLRIIESVLLFFLAAGCASKPAKAPESEPEHDANRSAYHQPLSTPGARFANLPQTVRSTVLAQAGMAEISDVEKIHHEGRVIYKISFREEHSYPPLFVGGDGSVLHPDFTVAVQAPEQTANVPVADLPPGVSHVLKEHHSESDVSAVSRENWGDHIVYIISFKDDLHLPKLYVVADGTTLIPAH
jgi:hypothetical protein